MPKQIDLFSKGGQGYLSEEELLRNITTPEQRTAALLVSAQKGLAGRAQAKAKAATQRTANDAAKARAAAPLGLAGGPLLAWLQANPPFCDWDVRRLKKVVEHISASSF